MPVGVRELPPTSHQKSTIMPQVSPVLPADIQPVADAAPTPEESAPPVEAAPEPAAADSLPPAVLKIPAMNALLNGSPPATYGPLKSKLPEVETLTKHADDLKKAGFAAFKSESMPDNFVLFNGLIIKPEEVMQADKNGQLDSVAVPFETLVKSFDKAKHSADVNTADAAGPSASEAAPGAAVAAPMPVGAPAPAGAQNRLLSARVMNLAPGGPTSGPAPGRGRVLNAISKPVV